MQDKNDEFLKITQQFLKMVDEKTEEFCKNKKGIADTTLLINTKVEVVSSINKLLKILNPKHPTTTSQ